MAKKEIVKCGSPFVDSRGYVRSGAFQGDDELESIVFEKGIRGIGDSKGCKGVGGSIFELSEAEDRVSLVAAQ